jgi:hypothetical protein
LCLRYEVGAINERSIQKDKDYGPKITYPGEWHLSGRLKLALDTLGITAWEPVVHVSSWTPHMEADQFGIKVSDEDALRIIDFLNANAREPTYE